MLVLTVPITIASTVPTKVNVDVVLSEMVILPKKVLKVYKGEKIHAVPQTFNGDIIILKVKKEISYKGEKVYAIPIEKRNSIIKSNLLEILSYNGIKVYAIPIVKKGSILNNNVKKDLLFVDLPLLIPLNVKVSN